MAFDYQNFASLGLNLARQKYGPLDISNVFTSENDLRYYLTKGTHTEGVSDYWKNIVPYPYEGQILATVIDGVVSVYVLALDVDGNFVTQEIAGKTEVDDKTIKVNADGKLELVGLDGMEVSKTYVPSLVNGVLTWAEPDTSTAEGQATAISALETRTTALETTINGIEASEGIEAQPGLVDKVATNASNIVAETEARDAAIATALQAAKDYADANDADTVYNDTEVRNLIAANASSISGLNEAISNMTHFTTQIVESTDEMTSDKVLYLIYDNSNPTGADKYNEYLVIAGVPTMIGDTSTNLTDYYTTEQTDKKFATIEALKALDTEVYGADKVASWTNADTGAYTPNYADETLISRLDQALADAAAAKSTADSAGSAAADNSTAITTLDGRVDELEGASGRYENRITSLETKVGIHDTLLQGFGTGEGEYTVKAYIDNSMANAYTLPVATAEALGGIKASAATVDNAVQVAADGIASVARINVNTLVQTAGEAIILNGGRA